MFVAVGSGSSAIKQFSVQGGGGPGTAGISPARHGLIRQMDKKNVTTSFFIG
jgi:hypothetical protein